MKEYIKLFEGLNAANGYEINDIPFTSTIKSVSGGSDINLLCNKPDASIIIENGKPKILTEVTITGTWNPIYSNRKLKVIIQGEVVLNGKVDCYSIEFAQGGHLTINPDARLRIWEGGIVNNDCVTTEYFEFNTEIVNQEYKIGNFLLHPNVSIRNPRAKCNLYTICRGTPTSSMVSQRIAIPIIEHISHSNNYTNQELTPNAPGFRSWFEYYKNGWSNIKGWAEVKMLVAYAVQNNTVNGGIIYSFIGNILTSDVVIDSTLKSNDGWFYAGNSYLSKLDIHALWQDNNSITEIVLQKYNNTVETFNNISETENRYCNSLMHIHLESSVSSLNLSYVNLIWNPSFEEDETPVSTRGLKSSPKSELILPDSPIFSDPIDAFANIDNSNLK